MSSFFVLNISGWVQKYFCLCLSMVIKLFLCVYQFWSIFSNQIINIFYFLLTSSTKPKIQIWTDSNSRLKFTDLIHIRVLPRISENVKSGVDVIQQVDDFNGSLCWCMFAAECIEPNNAAKKNGHVVVSFSRNGPLMPQFIGYRRRQNRIQQPETKRYHYFNVHSSKNTYVHWIQCHWTKDVHFESYSHNLLLCSHSKQHSCLLQFVKKKKKNDLNVLI